MRQFLLIAALVLFGSYEAPGEESTNPPAPARPVYALQANSIYGLESGSGSEGLVLVDNGTIRAAGKGITLPEGTVILSCRNGGFITPGLIDAASTAGVVSSRSWAEQTSEEIPDLHDLDAVDLDSQDFARLARQGVTAVYLTPDPASVIGCQGAVVRTAGPETDRVIRDGVDIKATLGPEAWRSGERNREPHGAHSVDYRTRRPVTRMGMAWVFRKAFFDAREYLDALENGTVDPGKADPTLAILGCVLNGEIPLRIKAMRDIDIWSSIRMCKEFGLSFVLEEGTEAYRCIPELKAYGVPVIYGPVTLNPRVLREGRGAELRPCLNTAGRLYEAGITLALTAAGLGYEDALPHQACYAIRNGLPFKAALNATTRVPARLLGVDSRLGVVKPGFDADLVLWTEKPFSPAAKPALVLIRGEIVYRDDRWIESK